MLKRAAVFVALAMFISMANLTDAHAEARGPKIFGLQVGMPWEGAVQIVKQYANKIGIRVYEEDDYVLIGKGDDRYVATYIRISRIFQNREKVNFLADMEIFPRVFNIENMDIEKLKIICNKYGIDLERMKMMNAFKLGYNNAKEGYDVLVDDFGCIQVKATESSSDMILE